MSEDLPVLVAGSPMRWTEKLAQRARDAEPLLAADGGANHLARIGLRPSAVIGDLDSIGDETRRWLGEEVLVHRPDQDRTDLDKALEYAFDTMGVTALTVLAALGGRTDHDLGNLGLLARWGLGERLVFEGDGYRIVAVAGETSLDAVAGGIWSFWTYDPAVRVSVEGVRWPVHSAPLVANDRPSISNQAIADQVTVSSVNGSVIVYRHLQSVDR